MNIDNASRIDGWMSYAELSWLAAQAATHKCIVEVGSYKGRSTRALGDNTLGRVIAIDDFQGPRDANYQPSTKEIIFADFNNNLDDLLKKKTVLAIRIDHDKVYENITLNLLQPDMVFIDGDHEYDSVCRDIKFWKTNLIHGGLLCGHDFNYPCVAKAVADNVIGALCAENSTIWYAIL